jgi:hypothetical protein
MQDFVEDNKEGKEKRLFEIQEELNKKMKPAEEKKEDPEQTNVRKFKEFFAGVWSQHKMRVKSSSKRESSEYFFVLGIQTLQNQLNNQQAETTEK